MAKPRAQGADAIVLLAKEVTPGTAVSGAGGGVYQRIPLRQDDVTEEQGLEDDPTWNLGTPEDGDAALGARTVSGDIVAPLDVRGAGFLLSLVLGASTVVETVADELWTHTWLSNKDVPTFTKQVGHPKLTVPRWRTQLGCKAGGLSFPMTRNGRALVTIPVVGMSEVKDVSGARDASPLQYPYLPFDNATGSVLIDGDALANLTGLQFNLSNNLDEVASIRPDMGIDGADESVRTANGTANIRFGSDSTIDDLVDGKLPCELQLKFALLSDPAWMLKVTLPRVFFQKTKKGITGPGGIEQPTAFRAARDATLGYLMKVELANDVDEYA